jgi:hypothetical protein
MSLTTGKPSSIGRKGAYFIDLVHIQRQKGKQLKNPAEE